MKKSSRVYVGDAIPPDTSAAERKAKRKLVSRLSHDISTEQLFSDDLIDGKVADGEDDENGSGTDSDGVPNDEEPGGAKQSQMYRIESHSALSSLEAKHLDKAPSLDESMESRATARPHKLAPLPGSPTARNSEAATSSGPAFRPSALLPTPEKEETTTQQPQECSQCSTSREMPPMHCAAYNGHVTCLELLLQGNQGEKQPNHLDKKQRTPLFYACAANRLDCCALLARVRRVWLNTADRQMDTPVHVCCFFGWYQCLQLLLDAGADPHGRNAKGFKPSHLAATPECLEALLAYGDDLLQGDKLGRSPLFVACARNRVACVEFLCAWNNQSRSWMLELEDQRGDRAIHAAACNGSAESLAVLLRYGADPSTSNGKGMSPKDLSVANKHPECEALLDQAEKELAASAGTWLAPANAVDSDYGASSADGSGDWVQCWDNDSGQAFYYNNLTGKCQWEVPPGFESTQPQSSTDNSQYSEASTEVDDSNEEYVWVKKKKQTVCVVTSRETEWTAVQDPASRAIYYKNTRTGQSQWEEPDAVRELASAAGARTSQEASRVWEGLDKARSALAAAIAREKRRQLEAHEQTLLQARLYVRQRREDIAKREEQARLAQLLPRSSFVRRKKQSMMMKVTTHNRQATKTTTKVLNGQPSSLHEVLNENEEEEDPESEGGAEARLEEICSNEPALDMFLSTYLKLRGVRDLQVLTTEKRLSNCLFHYYVALVDPVHQRGMSKSQFRVVLRDMNVIPGGAPAASASLVPSQGGSSAPLKLHVTDLIFSQAERTMAQEGSPTNASRLAHRQTASVAAGTDSHLSLTGFATAMLIVRERVVAQVEQAMQSGGEEPEIDDDEEWFMLRYLVPLSLRLGARLLTQIRRCKELDLQLSGSQESTAVAARQLLIANRAAVQLLHRHYSRRELQADSDTVLLLSTPKGASRRLAMLTFRGLALFATDFNLLTPGVGLPALHFLLEAVNWISGSAHTEVISFEKFQLLLVMLATLPLSAPSASPWASWVGDDTGASHSGGRPLGEALVAFFKKLAASPALIRVTTETNTGGSEEGDSGPSGVTSNPQTLFVLETRLTALNNNDEII
ncbi:Serine/threonine-protein phosphatase 6 regulatory ankyrin repeat subunit A [Phytophthora citrophthora]|uniref:Serine/threonine-protein phosphatase 6 regulatory ankyrin repeat subunit A n=1 Tax=Phytophthora citrophthora TaxID=4793 RepID=A0AAD9LHB7_9STRA|nr:Serine/threonine-protein phosphatase 6 regulatory ankyrin repeat subunit A [Phytophthora citrophthora]